MAVTNLERYRKDLNALISESREVEKARLLQGLCEKKYLNMVTNQLGGDEEKALQDTKKIKQFAVV